MSGRGERDAREAHGAPVEDDEEDVGVGDEDDEDDDDGIDPELLRAAGAGLGGDEFVAGLTGGVPGEPAMMGPGGPAGPGAAGPPGAMPPGMPPGARAMPDIKRWVTVYPTYLNPRLTVAEGRKLPKTKLADCDDPLSIDLAEAAASYGFSVVLEQNKRHPKVFDFEGFGRIRVRLFDDDHKPVHPTIQTRMQLFTAIAERVPMLPGRAVRRARAIEFREKMEEAFGKPTPAITAGGAAAGGAAAGGAGDKKGGNKKKARKKERKGR